MNAKVITNLILFAMWPLSACSIDVNESVPCESDDNCPSGYACNLGISRCEQGSSSNEDVTPDVVEETTPDIVPEVAEDAGDSGSDGDTTGDSTVEDTARDSTSDSTNEDPSDTTEDSAEADGCGASCGTCPDAEGMALITRPEGSFCIDIYEASRLDANETGPGVNDAQATSRMGVIPWSSIGMNAARLACGAAGKRLCTPTEWEESCGGVTLQFYPYNASEYNADSCNGADAMMGVVGTTGSRLLCVSPEGTLDMSGNLEEWVEGGFTRGGSYADDNFNLRCITDGESPDLEAPGEAVGFRCCADPI